MNSTRAVASHNAARNNRNITKDTAHRIGRHQLRLYVAAGCHNSVKAIASLWAICEEHLQGRYEIEIVDVFQSPHRALVDGIFVTPALISVTPQSVEHVAATTLGQMKWFIEALAHEDRLP